MRKRKLRFILAAAVCIPLAAAVFCLSVPGGIAALLGAVPILYLFCKPLIPTPAPIWYQYNNRIKPKLCAAEPSPKVDLCGFHDPVFEDFAADFTIAPHGSDANDGSAAAPFATFSRARQAVRAMDKAGKSSVTVAVLAGEYLTAPLTFDEADGGNETCPVVYRACGGEVILNGGCVIPAALFSPVQDPEILARLAPDARDHILAADLTRLGLTREQIGEVHVTGSCHTAGQYDGDYVGAPSCELFVDGARQTLARYPNGDEFEKIGKVIFSYGGSESAKTGTFAPEWYQIRNPQSDVFQVSEALARRIARWKEPEKAWMFGYWMYDWADASTPLGAFDPIKRELSPRFVSRWGIKKGAPYYFFNVLEELDAPGEWYIDREEMKLYYYPSGDIRQAHIVLSVADRPVVKIDGARHITFDGFTVQGTRADGIAAHGEYITIKNCTVKNTGENGIVITGSHNLVTCCRITETGKGGVILDGGDRDSLTPGENIVENSLIYDWAKICKTASPGVAIRGVGNVCRHNEMYNSPHVAVWYNGNDHLIESNHIHHTCLRTIDGGAIYTGKDWSQYGSTVRDNCIHDLGSTYYTACGIYLDDAISGQSVYGNLLVNIPGMAIQLGGGRDLTVTDNVIVNCTSTPISYDARAREGALFGGWFYSNTEPGGEMWRLLWNSPYKTKVWQEHYPQMAAFREDFADCNDPCFVPNPGRSRVEDNLIVDAGPFHGNIISRDAKRFSVIRNNRFFSLRKMKALFVDPQNGDYTRKEQNI